MKIIDKNALIAILELHPEVTCAFLYGSFLEPKYFNSESDLDIAILTKKPLTYEELQELQGKLELAAGREVDLVHINSDLSTILKHEIASKGELFFSRDKLVSDSFFINSMNEYFDLMYYRAPMEEEYLKRKRELA